MAVPGYVQPPPMRMGCDFAYTADEFTGPYSIGRLFVRVPAGSGGASKK